jgi:hypothetical protein
MGVSQAVQRGLREQLAGLEHRKAQQVLDELAGRMAKTQVRDPVRYCRSLVDLFKRGRFQPELAYAVAKRRQMEQPRKEPKSESGTVSSVAAAVDGKQLFESIRMSLEGTRLKLQREQTNCDSETTATAGNSELSANKIDAA